MKITDEMVTAACVALYRSSCDLEPTNDEMRAALAAALAVQPAEPVAWECKAGGLKPLTQRQYDAQPERIRRHYSRIQPARVPQPVTLPELPEPLDHYYVWDGPFGTRKFDGAPHNGKGPDRVAPVFTADQMNAHARQCAASWGVTLADEGGAK